MPLTAIIIRVPEAEPAVNGLRWKFDPTAALGLPAHITLLFPFMELGQITPEVLQSVEDVVASVHGFTFTLNEISRWPETTYLAPEPAQPFAQLTKAMAQRFPAYPPYSGKHAEIVPHLTVADGSFEVAEMAEVELWSVLDRSGPIHAICRQIELVENSSGMWKTMHVIALQEIQASPSIEAIGRGRRPRSTPLIKR